DRAAAHGRTAVDAVQGNARAHLTRQVEQHARDGGRLGARLNLMLANRLPVAMVAIDTYTWFGGPRAKQSHQEGSIHCPYSVCGHGMNASASSGPVAKPRNESRVSEADVHFRNEVVRSWDAVLTFVGGNRLSK